MVDKDDLFQEEDGINPQDHGRDEPSSDEDDDIIDLFDTVEIPADIIEEDIIELADTVEMSDDDIIELTEETHASVVDNEVLDLTEVVAENDNEPEDDILDLTDIADTDETEDEGVLDLTQKAEASEVDDDILDLTEPVIEDEPEDEIIDLLDTVEMSMDDMDNASDLDDNNLDAFDTAESPAAEEEVQDEILDLTEAVSEDDTSQTGMDQTESVEPVEPVQEELAVETATTPSVGYEEDKELLELIDDIQATLDDEPLPAHVDDREDTTEEDTTEEDEAIDTDTRGEDAETYTFLNDDEFVDNGDLPESETEFVDHLGIDLTSEIERKALEKNQDVAMEEVKPTEGMEPTMVPGSLETAVKQALTEMLADENSPLTRAIENAVKKALGQGENT